MKKKVQRPQRPGKLDVVTLAARQGHAHLHSDEVHARRIVLMCEADTVDGEIFRLTGALAGLRERRQKVAAQIAGLTEVLSSRC